MVVISGDAENDNPDWPVAAVVPCSTQSARKTKYCVKLNYGVGNVDKKCWARVVATQPLAKDEIGDYVGLPPAVLLADIHLSWAEYTGQV